MLELFIHYGYSSLWLSCRTEFSDSIITLICSHTFQWQWTSSSSSCCAASTDIPDPIVHRLWQVLMASGRSSGLHPVSSHSCCMYVLAGHPAFAWPYVGVHRSSSLMLLQDKFTYLGSSVSSTKKDIDTRLTKAWTAIDKLSIIWKSNLTDKMKRSFFPAAVVSILL